MTLMHSIEPGSYLVHTGSDTGDCFLLVQRRLTDRRESIEALQLCYKKLPATIAGTMLEVLFGDTGRVRVTVNERKVGSIVGPFSNDF